MGTPARKAMTRAMFGASDCCPTHPTITSSISTPLRFVRFRSSRNAASPNVCAVSVFSAPPKTPCGVRTPSTITTSAAIGVSRLHLLNPTLFGLCEPPELLQMLQGHLFPPTYELLRIEELQPVRPRHRGPQGQIRLPARHFSDLILHGLHRAHDDIKHQRRHGADDLLAQPHEEPDGKATGREPGVLLGAAALDPLKMHGELRSGREH